MADRIDPHAGRFGPTGCLQMAKDFHAVRVRGANGGADERRRKVPV